MNCSTPGFPVLHCLLEFTQTHVHWVSDAIQPSHPLSPPSPPALNLSQHQGLFQRVSSSHPVTKVLELQHQSFQWIFRSFMAYAKSSMNEANSGTAGCSVWPEPQALRPLVTPVFSRIVPWTRSQRASWPRSIHFHWMGEVITSVWLSETLR